ncbi:MAG: hypothetical protein ACYCTI_03485 [Acidimicrobiales bacterium]
MQKVTGRPPWAELVEVATAERGLSNAEVAGQLGLSPRAWRVRLSGRVRPLTSEIIRVGRMLDLSAGELMAAEVGPAGPDLELLTERDRKIYRASGALDGGVELPGVEEVSGFVNSVIAGDWWCRWAPGVTEVGVDPTPGPGPTAPAWHEPRLSEAGVSHIIHLPPWSRCPLTILHELAHVAAQPILWAKPHGPQWVRLWVDLVASVMGRPAAQQLRGALRAEGIGVARPGRVAADLRRGHIELERLLGMGGGEG